MFFFPIHQRIVRNFLQVPLPKLQPHQVVFLDLLFYKTIFCRWTCMPPSIAWLRKTSNLVLWILEIKKKLICHTYISIAKSFPQPVWLKSLKWVQSMTPSMGAVSFLANSFTWVPQVVKVTTKPVWLNLLTQERTEKSQITGLQVNHFISFYCWYTTLGQRIESHRY